MRVVSSVIAALSLASLAAATPARRDYATHDYFAVELEGLQPDVVARQLGVEVVERVGELEGHWLLRREKQAVQKRGVDDVRTRWNQMRSDLKTSSYGRRDSSERSLKSLQYLTTRHRTKRVHIPSTPLRQRSPMEARDELSFAQETLHLDDPMLSQQWHLINLENQDIELNVTKLWERGVTGEGVKVAIIDDGLDASSDDLKDNFYPEGSYDFNDHTELPLPRLSDDQHGTRCAGEIAAVPNDVCGVGVAYGAKVAGVRILSAPISDADEAAALNYEYQLNDIYSCSWGPPDDGRSMEGPEGLILKAMVNGVQRGRAGKGSIFVFAAGNGGGADDQCNFDGYTNSIFSLSIGAMDRKGLHPYYSELCAAMIAVAPSSGSGDHIHTTDVGKDKCAHNHGGTSAAAPLAAGVVALALQVRPELTWRDVQHLVVRSAVYFNDGDPDWEETAANRQFSYKYGYGKLDAGLFVEAAETWNLVKPQAWFDSPMVVLPDEPVAEEQPADDAPETGEAEIAKERAGKRQEEVDVPTETQPEDADQSEPAAEAPPSSSAISRPVPTPKGTVISSDGVQSTYEVTQEMLDGSNFERLEHVTVRVWIEHQRRGDVEVQLTSPSGIKSVLARQRRLDEDAGGFQGWKFMSMKHWDENPIGTWVIQVRDQINPDKVGRFQGWSLQLWGESVDPELARNWQLPEEGQPDEEEVGSRPPTVTSQKPKPTQLLPGDHGEAEGEAHKPGLATPTDAPAAGDEVEDVPSISAPDEGVFDGMNSLAKNSNWLAGAGMIILLAGAGVGAFFWLRARRRKRSLFGIGGGVEDRGSYAPVSEDVPMGTLGRRSRDKTGETGTKGLYDAFGAQSDDEDDLDDGLDEQAALKYHDDFLGDDEEPASASRGKDEYRDDEEGTLTPTGAAVSGGSGGSGSSSSWQDADEEVKRA